MFLGWGEGVGGKAWGKKTYNSSDKNHVRPKMRGCFIYLRIENAELLVIQLQRATQLQFLLSD